MTKVRLAWSTLWSLGFLALLAFGGPAAAQDEEHHYSGQDVYRLFCIVCHGPKGQGSPMGKPLIVGDALGRTDSEMMELIRKGRPDKGMMGFETGLSMDEIEGVMLYVKELQGRESQRRATRQTTAATALAKAEVRAGAALFNGKAQCIRCHSYYTRGGTLGPALDGLPSRLSPEQIREAVTDPSKTIVENYAAKEIVTKGRETLRGRFRYETEETVQLLSADATIWTTYFKRDVKSVSDLESSLMPENVLSELSKSEQDALFSFLLALK